MRPNLFPRQLIQLGHSILSRPSTSRFSRETVTFQMSVSTVTRRGVTEAPWPFYPTTLHFLSAVSQSVVAPGCEIPVDVRLCEMVRESRPSQSPQSFHNPSFCRRPSRSLRCSLFCLAAFRLSSG